MSDKSKKVSAHGLWAAMGKTTKPKIVRNSSGNYSKTDVKVRKENDFYPTPDEPVSALLYYEWERIKNFNLIWENAAGDGSPARLIERHGLKVVKSDLIDRGCDAQIKSFYEFTEPLAQCIITNPPYNEITAKGAGARWLDHTRSLNVDYVAMLLNWDWPAGVTNGMGEVMASYPISRVRLLRWKVDFTGEKQAPGRHAWFIWDKQHEGPTEFHFMDRKTRLQTEFDL